MKDLKLSVTQNQNLNFVKLFFLILAMAVIVRLASAEGETVKHSELTYHEKTEMIKIEKTATLIHKL